jgi:hypothetical protein
MIKTYPCLNEPVSNGYKQLYPNNYSRIIELQNEINPHPRNIDEAKNNRFINNKINELKEEIKNGKES